MTTPVIVPESDTAEWVEIIYDMTKPWKVVVWDDPVNLMSYVTYVFKKIFGYSQRKAHRLMMEVHEKGRAVVSFGVLEKCELDVYQLHEHGLWASMEQDD